MIKLLRLTCLMFFAITAGNVQAQNTVEGKVTSADDGEPLPGVNILVDGTSQGTVTDIEGNYSVVVGDDATLVYSFVGFTTVKEQVNGRSVVNVALSSDISELQEVVVIGYGTSNEDEITTAISTINSEDITKTPNSNPMQSLQGKVAGVQITSSGAPGASPNVRVRGLSSFAGDDKAQPLYVVDGMFVDNIDFLNPSDIASMNILKDASAAAIYGVRAANGVIIIETNSGDYEQPVKIEYDGYYGVQRPQNLLEMANTQQYVNYINQAGNADQQALIQNSIDRFGANPNNPNLPGTDTDWYDQVLEKTAPIQNHSLTISGGSSKVKYSVGGSFFKQDGLLKYARNDYERTNLRTKIDAKATDWLTVGGNVNISNATQFEADEAVWSQSYYAVPVLPVYDQGNTLAKPIRYANAQNLNFRDPQNPLFVLDNNNNRKKRAKILGNFYADLQLIPDKLSFKTSLNYFYADENHRQVDKNYSDGQTIYPNGIIKSSTSNFNTIWDNVLTYDNLFGDHSVNVTAGYSFRSEQMDFTQSAASNILSLDPNKDDTWYIPKGSNLNPSETYTDGDNFYGVSYFGRIQYGYQNKYLLSTSFRRDGSNKFSEKWGNFFTLSGGWIISRENFFDVEGIDFLKVRGGWGQMGNDGIEPAIGSLTYKQVSLALGNQLVIGVQPDNIFDLITSWETTEETNIGISAEFLDSRLTLDADVYRRDTKDAVLNVLLQGTGRNPRRNAGEIRNEGIEVAIGWADNISDDFSYNISANLSTLKNEVLSVGDQEFLYGGANIAELRQISIPGSSLNEFYGYEINGVFQNNSQIAQSGYNDSFISDNALQPGDFFFKDQNGDGVIDADDRVLLGSFIPTYNYGFSLGVNYKNLSLTASFQGQGGNKIVNQKRSTVRVNQDVNIDADLASHFWNGEGSTNSYPSAAGYRKEYNNNLMNEFWLEDGDYFRIQNVRLAYQFVNKELFGVKMPKTTISFTADRPLTAFNYNGFNPEVTNGVDNQTYPIPAVYTVGLNVQL
ncbi:SusC/RagA family TonB-linked outer membrane protein [Fulvivirga sediminis]|uniref:TonB-dependent receptor n=1 Tax=Fulvivirga sediminis TaxID=2803949 RepID=A0A937K0J2_9BACT|nr:TonB-dependent receptor [Fulvivirga sediminis]MBL3657699.1 TonB-dependent receptor [Fulvivirga sediminis]